jgi:hypothetical protein
MIKKILLAFVPALLLCLAVFGFAKADSSSPSVWAVGQDGKIIHFDQNQWNVFPFGRTAGELFSIWGIYDTSLYVSGGAGDIFIIGTLSPNDSQPLTLPAPFMKEQEYYDVKLYDTTGNYNFYALGNEGSVLHMHNGSPITDISKKDEHNTPMTKGMYRMWVYTDKDIYLAGTQGRIYHYDGTNWQQIRQTQASNLNQETFFSIWGGDKYVYFAGSQANQYDKYGLLTRLDRTTGQFETIVNDATFPAFISMWGFSDSDLYLSAGNTNNQSEILHYRTSGGWQAAGEISMTEITSLWGDSNGNLYLAGYNPSGTNPQIARLGGSGFTYWPVPSKINSIWGINGAPIPEIAAPKVGFFHKIISSVGNLAGRFVTRVGNVFRNLASGSKNSNNPSSQEVSDKTITVDAKKNSKGTPLDTKITLREGDIVTIVAEPNSSWKIGSSDDYVCGPSGCENQGETDLQTGMGYKITYGSLVGYVNGGIVNGITPYFKVDSSYTGLVNMFSAGGDGKLYLLCWDDVPADNDGKIKVTISVKHADVVKVIYIDAKNVRETPVDSGIALKEGDTVKIMAYPNSSWNISPGDPHICKPDGCTWAGASTFGKVDKAFMYGSIVGFLNGGTISGDTGYFSVGSNYSGKVDKIFGDGKLYLMNWDDVPDDNSGQIRLAIAVFHQSTAQITEAPTTTLTHEAPPPSGSPKSNTHESTTPTPSSSPKSSSHPNTNQPSSQKITKTFKVYAATNAYGSAPLDTGIDISYGDMVEITATQGEYWEIGHNTANGYYLGESNPIGFDSHENMVSFGSGQTFPYGSLVGKADEGLFLISNGLVTNLQSGRLYLMCWDDNAADNSGYITVQVKINE